MTKIPLLISLTLLVLTNATLQWPWGSLILPKTEHLIPEDITGTWYIVALFNSNSTPTCYCGEVNIENHFVDDGSLNITVTCHEQKADGPLDVHSYVYDLANDQNTEWVSQDGKQLDVIDFDSKNLKWLALGDPSYEELYIICRERFLDADVMQYLIQEAIADGFKLREEFNWINTQIDCVSMLT